MPVVVLVHIWTVGSHVTWRTQETFWRSWQQWPAVADRSGLFRMPFKVVPLRSSKMRQVGSILMRGRTSMLVKRSTMWR